MCEKWIYINDRYEVSNLGWVKRLEMSWTCRAGISYNIESAILEPFLLHDMMFVHFDNKRHPVQLLVADAFLTKSSSDTKLIHIDDDITNNCAENLKWE